MFLGFFTLGAIVLECVAGLWHPAGWTIPWTEYIAKYVPWPIQLAAYVILAVWLPVHFWRHDHQRGVTRPSAEVAASLVFEALGAASVCWDSLNQAGTFHSDKAKEIGQKLLADLGYQVPKGYGGS